MAGDPKNPVVGDFVFDGSEFAAYAVDLPPGGLQGLVSTYEGFAEACLELIANQASFGILAGITDQELKDLATANAQIERIDAFLPAILKAAEVLTETRYRVDDRRQRILLNAAQSVYRRAKQQPDLLARYERTRQYRSTLAKKALRTRRRNAEASSANQGGTGAGGASPGGTGAGPVAQG